VVGRILVLARNAGKRFRKKPKKTAGREAMKISFIFFMALGRRERVSLKRVRMGVLRKSKTEKKVAVFRKMSRVREGVRPKKDWKRLRWPEEEMGKNSEMAWTRARVRSWKRGMG